MATPHTPASTHQDPFQPPKVQRKIVIIKRGLQSKFVFFVTVFILIAVLSIGIDFYYHFGRLVKDMVEPELFKLFTTDTWIFVVKLALYMVAVVIFAVFASHKLAGPLYRFERSARAVGSGDLTHRVRIRTGDEMGEFADEFNLMVESLQRLVSQDQHLAARVGKHLNELINDKHIAGDAHQRLVQLKGDIERLHQGFKI